MTATPPIPTGPPPHPPAASWTPPVWSARLLRAHLVLAHLCLLLALGWTAWRPAGLLASVLHPEVLACVHLITLGCIATSCIGAFHVVLPIAMGTRLRADWRDWFLLLAVQLTATGVAAHMALGTYGGVQWSALLLLVALMIQLVRFVLPVVRAKAPFALRLGTLLAWTNLLLAVLLGGTLALQHTHPGVVHDPLLAIFGHAHLALGGFAGALVAAVGIRLLPMFLPAQPPPASLALTAVIGLGGGGMLCGIGAVLPNWLDWWFGCGLDLGLWILIAGAIAWLLSIGAMLVRRRPPPPPSLPKWLPAHALLGAAIVGFAAAIGLGTLLHGKVLDATWWPVYGSLLLVAGFGSLVLGIGQRLLPLAARLHAGPWSPLDAHRLPSPGLAWCTTGLWLGGILIVPFALRGGSALGLHVGFGLAAAAVAADTWNLLRKELPPRSSAILPPRP